MLNNKLEYSELINLIKKMPINDLEFLEESIKTELRNKNNKIDIKDLILNAPTWTDEDYQKYLNNREHINNSRLI